VKRFEFKLARVRDFRRQQLEVEESKLETLFAERQALEAESARLETEAGGIRRLLMVTGSAEAQELVAADRYLRYLAAEKTRHAARMADWGERARKQEAILVEARRGVRLLEKLEEKQLAEWNAEADREQENLSADLYLARWKSPHQ
jgi:flagellar export protein FliJ